MRKDSSKYAPLETGGVLLGYRSGSSAVVTDLIHGGPKALRTRAEFRPDGEWQAQKIAERYAESGYVTTYLGDWHSHPVGRVGPSSRDLSTAEKISTTRDAGTVEPLMLILAASTEGSWQTGAFIFRGRTFVGGPALVRSALLIVSASSG